MNEEALKRLAEQLGLKYEDLKELESKDTLKANKGMMEDLEIKKIVMSMLISSKGTIVPEKEIVDIIKWAEETRMRSHLLNLALEGRAGITMNEEGAAFYRLDEEVEREVMAMFEELEAKDG